MKEIVFLSSLGAKGGYLVRMDDVEDGLSAFSLLQLKLFEINKNRIYR